MKINESIWKIAKGTSSNSLQRKITFCKDGIIKLIQRWQRKVEQKSRCVFQINLMSKVKKKNVLLVNKQDELSK